MAKLPKRFRPLQQQALTEADIRYGGQQAALGSIFDEATRGYQKNVAAQQTATAGLLGALNMAPVQIHQAYTDAGLTPGLLSQIGNSPTGQRLAGEMAAALAGVAQQRSGANAGAIYQLGHLTDQYREDVGKVNQQSTALAKERGEFTQSLLDQLIGADRSARHDANQHVKDQQFTADQNAVSQANNLTRTIAGGLISQGVQPEIGPDGSVGIGGKIPGAKSNQPKAKARPKATPDEQQTGGSEFGRAVRLASQLLGSDQRSPGARNKIGQMLTSGRPASKGDKGQPVFDPKTGKRVIDPKTGVQKVTRGSGDRPAIKPVDDVIASAALDMVFDGHVSSHNVQRLHHLGYTVRDFPGLRTQFDVQRQRAQHPYTLPNRQGTAPTRAQQPG
jgi:hypothetical protein